MIMNEKRDYGKVKDRKGKLKRNEAVSVAKIVTMTRS